MSTLFIPIGIPGCGKSRMATYLGDVHRVSTDAIRQVLTGDESNQDANGEVFKRFHAQIAYHLRRSQNVYADATNLTGRVDLRRIVDEVNAEYRAMVNPYGSLRPVRTHVILFRNLSQALQRNAARERVVPDDVMLKMIQRYEQAVMDLDNEDYDFVTEVRSVR
jgi:predicted kinase